MAHTEKLGRWLVDNSQALDLKVQRNLGMQDWIPGFFDIRVEININERVSEGRGFAESEDLAFIKAGAEAIERSICQELGIRSSGVAVHTSEDLAKMGARLELVERDLMLCHHVCRTPPIRLQDFNSKKLDFRKMQSQFSRHGIAVELYELNAPLGLKATVCVATDSEAPLRFGSIMGSACTLDLDTSCFQALNECVTNIAAWLGGNFNHSIRLREFNAKTSHDPADHSFLYLHPESQILLDYFYEKNTNFKAQKNIDLETIELIKLESCDSLLRSAPIFCYRAFSNQLQSMFYGPTQLQFLNESRLLEFDHRVTNYNLAPHSMG